jgi:hypothetical protein
MPKKNHTPDDEDFRSFRSFEIREDLVSVVFRHLSGVCSCVHAVNPHVVVQDVDHRHKLTKDDNFVGRPGSDPALNQLSIRPRWSADESSLAIACEELTSTESSW